MLGKLARTCLVPLEWGVAVVAVALMVVSAGVHNDEEYTPWTTTP